ncbi:MAG: choice-of-anchor R domain-containing protein [Planctomycetota bacterium]
MTRRPSLHPFAVLLPLTTAAAHADIVYDNLGPANDYQPQVGWVVSDGPPFNAAVEQAMPFRPSAAGALDRIEFPMTMAGGPATTTILVDVYSDAGGLPGASLESASLTALVVANPSTPPAALLVADFSDSLVLDPTATYWVVIAHGAPLNGNFLVWNQNTAGDMGDVADRRDGGPGWNLFTGQTRAAFRVSTADAIGMNYCSANANSTGSAAVISAAGTPSVAANALVLECSGMPTQSFSFFLASRMQGFVAMPGGSAGNLCLGGSIGRLVGPGQIQNSGLSGSVELPLDLTQTPTPTGFVSVQVGETWNYQCWFRDVSGGAATSNFSDGLSIVFV